MAETRIQYAGVAICADARVAESGDGEMVVETAAPMPVGTSLQVDTGGGPLWARVVEAIGGAPGRMRLSTAAGDRTEKEKPAARKGKKSDDRNFEGPFSAPAAVVRAYSITTSRTSSPPGISKADGRPPGT